MSAIWKSANWTRQFGIRQTGNRQFGMLPNNSNLYTYFFKGKFGLKLFSKI
jgi:hypothetical protein